MKPERRHTAHALVRATSSGRAGSKGGKKITGYAAVFDSPTDIGPFTEEIAQGAFSDVLDDDVMALFNHDPDHILGRTSAGTLRLSEDDVGLRIEVDLNPNDLDALTLHSRVERGDISGMSFSFTTEEADEELGTKDGKRHRIIKRVSKLYDVGPVTFPAYESTEISARCAAWADCGGGRFSAERARLDEALKDPWQTQLRRERARLDRALRQIERPIRNSRSGGRASTSSREGTAYHEAGHVILARADGHAIEWVEINKSGGGTTCFRYNGVTGLRSPASTLAGPIASDMSGHRTKGWGAHMDRAHDQARLGLQYRSREARTIDQIINQEGKRAREVLKRHWTEVQRLAAALLVRGRIEGSEIEAIVSRAA